MPRCRPERRSKGLRRDSFACRLPAGRREYGFERRQAGVREREDTREPVTFEPQDDRAGLQAQGGGRASASASPARRRQTAHADRIAVIMAMPPATAVDAIMSVSP